MKINFTGKLKEIIRDAECICKFVVTLEAERYEELECIIARENMQLREQLEADKVLNFSGNLKRTKYVNKNDKIITLNTIFIENIE